MRRDPDLANQNFKNRIRILLALTKNQFKQLRLFFHINQISYNIFKVIFYLKFEKLTLKCVKVPFLNNLSLSGSGSTTLFFRSIKKSSCHFCPLVSTSRMRGKTAFTQLPTSSLFSGLSSTNSTENYKVKSRVHSPPILQKNMAKDKNLNYG